MESVYEVLGQLEYQLELIRLRLQIEKEQNKVLRQNQVSDVVRLIRLQREIRSLADGESPPLTDYQAGFNHAATAIDAKMSEIFPELYQHQTHG